MLVIKGPVFSPLETYDGEPLEVIVSIDCSCIPLVRTILIQDNALIS